MILDGILVAATLGFVGSIHCLGMCGGFVLATIPPGAGRWRRLGDQLLLQAGKATSYAFLGALAGLFGQKLLGLTAVSWAGRGLAIVAGLLIGGAGAVLLGFGRAGALGGKLAPLFRPILAPLVDRRPTGFPLVVGLLMGFLPCPLVWAGLGAAAATGSPAAGALSLAALSLGTIPMLLGVALVGGTLLPIGWRGALARASGVLLLALAAVTVWRGVVPAHDHAAHLGHGAKGAAASHDCCAPGGTSAAAPSASGAAAPCDH